MYPWRSLVFVILLQALEITGSPTWPYGKYTLLKPRTGCPDGWDDKGYLYQDNIDEDPGNTRSETLHIDGSVNRSRVKRHFCSKVHSIKNRKGKRRKRVFLWPPGQYCVYTNKGKSLPDMEAGSTVYDSGNDYENNEGTTFDYSCKTSGNKKRPISLPKTKPFYLLPYESRDCQQVKWMVATSEWIRYQTRTWNYDGRSYKNGTVPYHELGDNNEAITMYYCYYEKCRYTLKDKEGVFQSPGFPGKYPDGQLCSWTIVVPDNLTLHVRFTDFSLDDKDILKYSQLNGNKYRSWFKISVYTVPPFTLSSNSTARFVFRSDESNTSTGFRAEYRVDMVEATTAPTEEPTETPTTSPVTKLSTISTTLLSNRKPSTTKPSPIISRKRTKDAKALTPQPPPQHKKSNAKDLRGSPFSSTKKTIIVMGVASVCLLIGIILLILIIHQCRVKRRKLRAKNSKRGTEEPDRAVMNPTYERGPILLNSPKETVTASTAVDGGDNPCVTPEYENVKCERSNKANRNRNMRCSESVKGGDHVPLHHVSELHDPRSRECPSQTEGREPNPLYHVLEGPVPNNLPEVELDEDQVSSRPREAEPIKDSGPNPLYHVLEGPDSDNVGVAEAQTYEDVD